MPLFICLAKLLKVTDVILLSAAELQKSTKLSLTQLADVKNKAATLIYTIRPHSGINRLFIFTFYVKSHRITWDMPQFLTWLATKPWLLFVKLHFKSANIGHKCCGQMEDRFLKFYDCCLLSIQVNMSCCING